jgi:Sigma-54 interaction domain
MENRFRVTATSPRAAESRDRQTYSEELRLAEAAQEELLLMGMPRVNVLIAGRAASVRPVIDTLLSNVQKPIACWFSGEPLVLPAVDRVGTLMLTDVGAMGLHDQIQLLEWLARAMGRAQVISTTETPLLPRVRAGSFIDTLYYRLNMVYLDVTGLEEAA